MPRASDRMTSRLRGVLALLLLTGGHTVATLPAEQKPLSPAAPPIEVLVSWLDDRDKAWTAEAWLQQIGQPAVPAILAGGRTRATPNCTWSARMDALAKIGEPAIPRITERLLMVLGRDPLDRGEAAALVDVLAAIGPPAIPALVRVALETTDPWIAEDALGKFVPFGGFGQEPNPWSLWHPEGEGPDVVGRHVRPELPRVREILEREVGRWRPEAPAPQRPAAYLLARWGTGADAARGLAILNGLARTQEPFYRPFEAIKLLHRLRAPGVGPLLQQLATRISDVVDLKDQYLTGIAVALYQIGDDSYVDFISKVLAGSNPVARTDAVRFVGDTGNLRFVPLLIDLLDERKDTGGDTLADLAHMSLQKLTFQSIPHAREVWITWWQQHRNAGRQQLLSAFVETHAVRIRFVSVQEASQLIEILGSTVEPAAMPLVRAALLRADWHMTTGISDFGGPIGQYGPRIVTYVLRFLQHDEQIGRDLLHRALDSPDREVRQYSALVLGSYDKRAAVARLARDLAAPDREQRNHAPDFLLALGDARGISAVLDRLAGGHQATMHFTCETLHFYTQQPLTCDANVSPAERRATSRLWHSWWKASRRFQLKQRQAEFDRTRRRGAVAVC